jgi:hypothetical protein
VSQGTPEGVKSFRPSFRCFALSRLSEVTSGPLEAETSEPAFVHGLQPILRRLLRALRQL